MTPHISTMGFGFEGATAGQKLVRCAIYTRFSSDMQRLTSTEDQIRECRDAAKRNGWVILDEYIFSDEAVSGQMLTGRDGLDRLLAAAKDKSKLFDCILIDDTSRFGRNLSDTLPMTDILQYVGVFLYFVTRRLDSRDPNFRSLYITYGQQDEKPHRKWNACTIHDIVRNEKYHGVHVWNKTGMVRNPIAKRKEQRPRDPSEWERVEVPEWRIVSEELWTATQAEIKRCSGISFQKAGGLNRTDDSRKYVFSGLMVCAKCGSSFTSWTARVPVHDHDMDALAIAFAGHVITS